MKVLTLRSFIIFTLAAISGAALLHTSQRVQHAEDSLASLKSDIRKERETISILEAEWEYLNRPERLEKLAKEHLDLVAPSPKAMPDEVIGKAASLPKKQQTEEQGELGQPVSFTADESVPKPVTKPHILRIEKPQKPLSNQEAPIAEEQQEVKAFDTLLNELGTGAGP